MAQSYLAQDAANTRFAVEQIMRDHPELVEDETLRADMLEGSTDLIEMLSRVIAEAQDADALAKATKSRMDTLASRKARFDTKNKAMRKLAMSLMEAADERKITLPEATLSITKARERCEIEDANDLPQGYFELVRKPDTAAIKAVLQNGETIPGARLTIGEESLTVRTA